MKHLRLLRFGSALLAAAWSLSHASAGAPAVAVPSRILTPIDAGDRVTLTGNTHPLPNRDVDQGRAPAQRSLGHLFLALQRSESQERELTAFNARQYDPASPDYHHWLQPEEFGDRFGPNEADTAAVTAWLRNSGFQILGVSPGRISIEFAGTAAQIESAFHVEMHTYLVDGTSQISNDRDPQIPRALSPVVTGVSGLNDFPLNADVARSPLAGLRAAADSSATLPGAPADLQPSAGVEPQFTMHDGTPLFEFVAPYDLSTIYNSLPLWKDDIIGSGVTIAVIGDENVNPSDIKTFRSYFGLPANVAAVEYVGKNPDATSVGSTVELEMAGAAAPGAKLTLVVPDASTNSKGATTIAGFLSAIHYIVAHNAFDIVSAGFSSCELFLGTSNNAMLNSVWQQAATQGMSVFVSAGSGGSAGCQSTGRLDTYGLQVNGVASSPFVTAVGATDFAWDWITNGGTTYWNATNDVHHASAKGYVPEYPWNVSCANKLLQEDEFLLNGKPRWPYPIDVCNAIENSPTYSSLVTVQGGGGGYSHCTVLNTSGACESGSGYAKPSWQTGKGVPADGKRDLPDVALFAAGGWPPIPESNPPTPLIQSSMLLGCYSGSGHACEYDSYSHMIYQAFSGSAASAAYWVGIMALVEQKHGGTRQGLVNLSLYKTWSKESLSSCDTLTVKAGNSCTFYDIAASLSNAQPCKEGSTKDCDAASSVSGVNFAIGILTGYQADIGYDQATGLGSVNIANLVDTWPATAPTPLMGLSAKSLEFGAVAVGSAGAPQTLTLKNTGSVGVTFKSGGITLKGSAAFIKTTTCGTALEVGGSCTITLTFKPTAVGNDTATLSIADNATGSPQTVSLTGSGKKAG